MGIPGGRGVGVARSREQGSGNREQGIGDREQGTGNREQGTGNREQWTVDSGQERPAVLVLVHSFIVRRAGVILGNGQRGTALRQRRGGLETAVEPGICRPGGRPARI